MVAAFAVMDRGNSGDGDGCVVFVVYVFMYAANGVLYIIIVIMMPAIATTVTVAPMIP